MRDRPCQDCPWYVFAELGRAVALRAEADELVRYWLMRHAAGSSGPQDPPPLTVVGH